MVSSFPSFFVKLLSSYTVHFSMIFLILQIVMFKFHLMNSIKMALGPVRTIGTKIKFWGINFRKVFTSASKSIHLKICVLIMLSNHVEQRIQVMNNTLRSRNVYYFRKNIYFISLNCIWFIFSITFISIICFFVFWELQAFILKRILVRILLASS